MCLAVLQAMQSVLIERVEAPGRMRVSPQIAADWGVVRPGATAVLAAVDLNSMLGLGFDDAGICLVRAPLPALDDAPRRQAGIKGVAAPWISGHVKDHTKAVGVPLGWGPQRSQRSHRQDNEAKPAP